ncbi:MAG: DoxX family membrane protein [Planctomycetes bacterium]|nr:DoxX family membrane protein [Planctomycetota bacterium]
MSSSNANPSFGLVLVRIAVGALLLHEARELWVRGIGPWIVEDTAFRVSLAPEWYRDFADAVVFRAPALWSYAIPIGSACAGVAFFLGAAVRPAALGVVFLMLNVILAGPASRREYAALTACAALACFVSHAGSRIGLDTHLPRWLSWSRAKGSGARKSPGSKGA